MACGFVDGSLGVHCPVYSASAFPQMHVQSELALGIVSWLSLERFASDPWVRRLVDKYRNRREETIRNEGAPCLVIGTEVPLQ